MITLPKQINVTVENPPLKYTVEKYNLYFKNELVLENAGTLAITNYLVDIYGDMDIARRTAVALVKGTCNSESYSIELLSVKNVFIEHGSDEYKNAQESWEKNYDELHQKRLEKSAAEKVIAKAEEKAKRIAKDFQAAEKLHKEERKLFDLIESHETGLDYKKILQYESAEDFRKMKPWYILNENYQVIDLVKSKEEIRHWLTEKECLRKIPSRQSLYNYIKANDKFLNKYYFVNVQKY